MSERAFIIAEAGVNHNGSLDLALKLVDVAAEAGVDAVKFQTFRADTLVSSDAPKAEYQKKNDGAAESQYEMLKRLELSDSDHMAIVQRCAERGVEFLSTPFDVADIEFLCKLGLSRMKVPSGAITDYPYLRRINECGLPVLLSTGMSTLDEVSDAVAVLKDCPLTLLHCTTEYPCPYNAVNLRAMIALKNHFGFPVGYSDHTEGIGASFAAVAMGASVIEKHFTLDKSLPGPDHKASATPKELKELVAAIRRVECALGDGHKIPASVEIKNIAIARKSIVAKVPINSGEIFTEDNLTTRRPGTGLSPMMWPDLIGKSSKFTYAAGDMVRQQ